jgi:signal transduction histidine kinase
MRRVRVDVDFDALTQFVSDGLAYVLQDGTVGGWSEAAAAVTEITRLDASGTSLERLFARIEPPLEFAPLPQELVLWTKGEHRRPLHATSFSLEDGWLISFGREQNFAAIEQLKSEIVTAVSHELKTPIATIKAFATTLRQNPGTSESDRDEYLATIEEEADRLARGVDELLLAGRVDAAHLVTRRERITIEALLDHARSRIGPTRFARVVHRTDGVTVDGDPVLLGEALEHLIDNALKFSSDTAPVEVDAAHEDGITSIRVIDRGVGIAADHLPYIFERFYRAERELTATTGGSGLGLYVARAIAHAHGGSLAVERTGRAGTVMQLRIPARA